jgi:hypothetical protein
MKLALSHYGKNTDRVFEKRVLGRIFGLNTDEIIGG